jgi:hypothetical protein
VQNWRSLEPPEQCAECEPDIQKCDETHQQVPKPAQVGIWIDPVTGDALWCEPYVACIFHQTVEEVLRGGCSDGYMVGAPLQSLCLLRSPGNWSIFALCSRSISNAKFAFDLQTLSIDPNLEKVVHELEG